MKRLFFLLALFSLACVQSAAVAPAPGATATSVDTSDRSEVSPTATVPDPEWTVCADVGLNVRRGPSEAGPVLRTLERGESVRVGAWRQGWALIGVGEWVNGDYLCSPMN